MSKFKDVENSTSLKSYLSKEDISTLAKLKQALVDDDILLTCMGLYNHGKSSVLNALIEDYEDKTFKTADIRETTKNKKAKHGNITFVDTPGLNAQKHDDKRVMDAAKESDINLFVHNVNTGEFVASEVAFFHEIKKHWNNPIEFIQRTIFVLSRIDEAQNDADIKNTALKMKQQIKEIFEVEARIIPVSSKDYKEGMIEKEEGLIEESNLKMLQEQIRTLSDKLLVSIKKTKKERIEKYYDGLIQKLSSRLEKEKLELNQLENEQSKREKSFQNDLKMIEKTLINKYKQLAEV